MQDAGAQENILILRKGIVVTINVSSLFFTDIERILDIKFYYLLSYECQFEHTFEHPCLCNVTMTHMNRHYLAPMGSVCIISHILL